MKSPKILAALWVALLMASLSALVMQRRYHFTLDGGTDVLELSP